MRSVAGFTVVLSLAVLAGCAGWNGSHRGSVVVDYQVNSEDISGRPKVNIVEGNSFFDVAGATDSQTYPPVTIRQCNAQRTECSLGIVTLTSKIQIISIDEQSTKLRVDFVYKVGEEWRRETSSTKQVHSLPMPEVIKDQGRVTRTADIPYSETRRVELPYGLSLSLCVSAPGVTTMNQRPCTNQMVHADAKNSPAF
ncbi:hypothetical protein FBY04_14619 [Pseudomonas sp. SJZ080]|uniref:hypothetical protein n=1 Tax=Pseudomonas sp. SJZ080 TaxID=2572888 RepID=UPI0011996515|nr:hypothetical protein [Pseudomonas sp. SJZ080]TWC44512.1 hypothetical protein FBY04_14619 [Pseudomonas sp. SJZ080]